MYCLSAENGEKIWEFKTSDSIRSSPAISNGKIYFGSNDKKFYCLNAENGKKLWEYETDGAIRSSPAIANGRVYVGSDDGRMYCFGDAE